MPTSEVNKSLLTTATEKPSHYRYLKEFRVEQCPLFPQHKCTQHRPFTCFNWHFPNQRRRRPVRKRDGLFNYSPDTYCTKYDETQGTCPDGDECPFLHRTAGDTERRYHLRYFKTCMCVYETDTRGYCVKNGAHCAFAHGDHDKRPPVYDIRELTQTTEQEQEVINGPNQLDKERNMMIDDPKWQDASYVLLHYKTEPCKRPPRLCRQGYACPQYHNLRDRRRSPKKHKYRSTPCPNVKHGDEWGEPTLCEEGDECPYCHTRTEQQFHPEIYKSSKCNDVFTNQYCPRGPFCAFAHADHEMQIDRNLPTDTNFADILSNVLPTSNIGSMGGMGMMMIGPVGSKPGESNNNNNNNGSSLITTNGNGTPNSIILSNNNSSLNLTSSNTNGVMESLGFFTQGCGGLTDLSDVLRNACVSPLDHHHLQGQGNGGVGSSFFGGGNNASSSSSSSANTVTGMGGGGNGGMFGVQSFASAVGGGTDRSNSSNSSASHGGKFFEDQPKGNQGGGQHNFYDTFDNILSFGGGMGGGVGGGGDEQRDAYSLFPSMNLKSSAVRDDMSRGDSPSTIDKDLDCSDHFSPGGVSKPVSIPTSSSASTGGGFFSSRDRFPSGSNSLNNSFGMRPLFSNPGGDPTIDQKSESISNHLANIFDYSRGQGTNSTMSPSGNLSNGFGNGPGPIGSNVVLNNGTGGGGNNNGLYNNGNQMGSYVTRPDLCYQSTSTLIQHLTQCKSWVDILTKAIKSYADRDSPQFACLLCKNKDRARSVIVLPCDHQVLCSSCGPSARMCPLCGNSILTRKPLSTIPSNMDL